jgi:hypothetical protein
LARHISSQISEMNNFSLSKFKQDLILARTTSFVLKMTLEEPENERPDNSE